MRGGRAGAIVWGMDLDTPGLHLRSRMLAAGATSDEIQRTRRAGALVPIRRGAYLLPDDERLRRPVELHGLLVRAAVGALAPTAVVSHVSAAVVHGLPVWLVPLGRVHVTRAEPAGGRVGRSVHRHVAPLTDDEIAIVDEVRVTAPARTVVDVARTVPSSRRW